jgi:hypothetical protein
VHGREWAEHGVELAGAIGLWALAAACFALCAIGAHPPLASNRRVVVGLTALLVALFVVAKAVLVVVKVAT